MKLHDSINRDQILSEAELGHIYGGGDGKNEIGIEINKNGNGGKSANFDYSRKLGNTSIGGTYSTDGKAGITVGGDWGKRGEWSAQASHNKQDGFQITGRARVRF